MTLRIVTVVLLLLLCLSNLSAQQYFVERSRGLADSSSATFSEARGASSQHFVAHLAEIRASLHSSTSVVSDSSNRVIAAMESFFARGVSFVTPAADMFAGVTETNDLNVVTSSDRRSGEVLTEARSARFRREAFKNVSLPAGAPSIPFIMNVIAVGDHSRVLVSGPATSIVNRRRGISVNDAFVEVGAADARDDLVFVETVAQRNAGYSNAGIYSLEGDTYFPGNTDAAAGEALLFEVLNPTSRIRIELSLTRTVISTSDRSIGKPFVAGEGRAEFSAVGRGAMHLMSAPLTPQRIDGHAFVVVYPGSATVSLTKPRHGLFALYGKDVAVDARHVSVFFRNISALDANASVPRAPRSVTSFPADLANPSLEYSGVYEDGWVSEHSLWVLSGFGNLRITGVVPMISSSTFHTQASVLVDGEEALHQDLGIGEFQLDVPGLGNGNHRIELMFSHAQRLPGDDGRIAGALLHSIEIRRGN